MRGRDRTLENLNVMAFGHHFLVVDAVFKLKLSLNLYCKSYFQGIGPIPLFESQECRENYSFMERPVNFRCCFLCWIVVLMMLFEVEFT
jgi:hypothetical protein